MRLSRFVSIVVSVWLVSGCAVARVAPDDASVGPDDASASDAPVDGGATPSPDGMGVCCPRSASMCVSPRTRGGFAPSPELCPAPERPPGTEGTYFDRVDSHGCPRWDGDLPPGFPGDVCCGCFARPDAGADASVDDAAVGDVEATVERRAGVACDLDDGAPPGSTCSVFLVTCSGVEPLEVELRDSAPTEGAEVGVVVLGSGGNGARWSGGYRGVTRELRAAGYRVLERRWRSDRVSGWLEGGMAEGACRYATLVRWIREHVATAAEPVCVSGNSGGAGEIGAALTRHGIDDSIDLAVMTSGPLARVDYACGREAAWEPACTPLVEAHAWSCESGARTPSCGTLGPERALFDDAYLPTEAACSTPTEESLDRLAASSPVPPGAVPDLSTDIRILVGGNDCSLAPAQALLFGSRVTARGVPIVVEVIADAPHELPGSDAGQPVLLAAIRDGCVRH